MHFFFLENPANLWLRPSLLRILYPHLQRNIFKIRHKICSDSNVSLRATISFQCLGTDARDVCDWQDGGPTLCLTSDQVCDGHADCMDGYDGSPSTCVGYY